ILGLPYPGGPLIDKHATMGNPKAYSFTKPKVPGLDFSFSGLKTAILYFVRKNTEIDPDFIHSNISDICASVQHTIVEILMDKMKLAVVQTGISQVAIGGGVSANSGIRKAMTDARGNLGWKTFIPKFEYTTDNAAMIGITAYFKYLEKDFTKLGETSKARIEF
ncbi:MAG: tRNA (adenosine(37)-N6)-threonylcarbamoyltransferase complex transferase subunit TsaD, partial [Chitinophagaceae bacterium]